MAFSTDKTRQAASGNGGGGTEGFFSGMGTSYTYITGVSFSSTNWKEHWGYLSQRRSVGCTNTTSTHGYMSGGTIGSGTHYNTIDRFSFASTGNSTDVGDLTQARNSNIGAQNSTRGFSAGGSGGYATFTYNIIDSILFASSANATDWGDTQNNTSCSGGIGYAGGAFDGSYAYIFGGYTPCGGSWYNTSQIQQYSMSSSSNASNWGSMSANGGSANGAQSSTYMYAIAGTWGNVYSLSFASGGTMSTFCNLVSGRTTGGKGTTYSGDDVLVFADSGSTSKLVDKFSMASTSSATSWGDITSEVASNFESQSNMKMDV